MGFIRTNRQHTITSRIRAYEEELHFFLKFFDVKSFIIMAVMMTGGIWLRSSGVAPDRFIAFFYTGLGASLLAGGTAVRLQLRQGPRRQGQGVISEIRSVQSSFETMVSKLLFLWAR